MHVDDVMCAQAHEPEADDAVEEVRKNFDFGKWKKLSEKSPITYCGCQISILHGEINRDAEENLKQVKPITVERSRQHDGPGSFFVAFSDAAFGIRRDFSSQGGYILVAANKKLLEGECMRYTPLAWRSFKLDRVCRSSLSTQKPKHVRQQRTS